MDQLNDPAWLEEARKYLGEKEIKGAKHNPIILQLWSWARLPFQDDETPWCAGFVNGVLEVRGFKGTRKPNARSFLQWGFEVKRPTLGCVIVFSRPGSSWSGHVGFEVGTDAKGWPLVLGGNQGDRVSIASFDPERVLSRRWPVATTFDQLAEAPRFDSAGEVSQNEA